MDKKASNMKIVLPELLNIPPKLMPVITEFNNYRYFYLEGGRGSGKTHTAARLLLYLTSTMKIRAVCGREIQKDIDRSVHTVLNDIINAYNLNFEVQSNKIINHASSSTIAFKGFREYGKVSLKGLEGVDIVWVDEAETLTRPTLQVLIPTMRKTNSRFIFTMNRFMDDDAVHEEMVDRLDCLHIHIDYFENPFCTIETKKEAAALKRRSIKEYNHVYLGKPLSSASNNLFNFDKLSEAYDVKFVGRTDFPARVLSIDFAAQGDDQCIATVLDRVTEIGWKLTDQIAWDESDSMISVGRIVSMIGEYKPTISILDVGGMGHVVYNRLVEIGVDIQRFDGASIHGVDTTHYVNARANGYYELKDWFERGNLHISRSHREVIKELRKIRMLWRSNGKRLIEPKISIKKELGHSPDRADSLMMGIWCISRYLSGSSPERIIPYKGSGNKEVKRISKSRNFRRARRT